MIKLSVPIDKNEPIIKYEVNYIKQLNKDTLKKIPTTTQYENLKKFCSSPENNNLSNIIKRPVIPPYLKNKFATNNHFIPKSNLNIRRNNQATRKKLYDDVDFNFVDKINGQIRNILSKLSEGNKAKLLDEFSKCDITDECCPKLVDNIYLFAVDVDYLLHIYVELIMLLKKKNLFAYDELINKILNIAYQPLTFPTETNGDIKAKKWRLSNIKLIGEIYKQNNSDINNQIICSLLNHLQKEMSPSQPESLEILCELLKSILLHLIKENKNTIDNIIKELTIANKNYELRYRFMIQDVIELYNYDSDDD